MTMDTKLNSSMATAYSVQRISWFSSTVVTRKSSRSMGRNTGSINVFSRLNTRAMWMPMGFVTRNTSARNKKIWNQPFAVMSKLLRAQQCVHQVHSGQNADGQHDHRFQVHSFIILTS